jgi:hypothetical protein
MLNRTIWSLALMLAAVLLLNGCNNGLPSELTHHLARHGIIITPARVHAPLSSRGGYVVTRHVPETATNLIATFALQEISPDDEQWHWVIEQAGGVTAVKELWGVTGRPMQFKLSNGAQFEHFYLLITENGFMYLLAEYAYG